MVFKAFWHWIPCLHRARSILEPASVLRRGLSAAFRVICSILSRVSFWIYFRLVRVYLGDQRMRRVKDQDEEGKGPGDQEDPGTRGPRDQRTRGPGDQRTRGPKDQGNLKLFFPGNLDFLSSIIPSLIPDGTSKRPSWTAKCSGVVLFAAILQGRFPLWTSETAPPHTMPYHNILNISQLHSQLPFKTSQSYLPEPPWELENSPPKSQPSLKPLVLTHTSF